MFILKTTVLYLLSVRHGLMKPEVVVTRGQVDLGHEFLGQYTPGTRRIQVKESAGLRVWVHEWAHYLQWVRRDAWPVQVSPAEKARYEQKACSNGQPGKFEPFAYWAMDNIFQLFLRG